MEFNIMKSFPKVYLAIDNCFASKRWTKPREWMELIKNEFGIYYAEASADTECDPLYTGPEYLSDWIEEVKLAEKKTGVTVANLYSGHGTYSTLGLGHTDTRVRQRMLSKWLKPMADTAYALNAGLGFYCHAFPQSVMQSPEKYKRGKEELYELLSNISAYAGERYGINIGIEQMYAPHQIPWTLEGTKEMLGAVYSRSGQPFYTTIDTGHQSGQYKFLLPTKELLAASIRSARTAGRPEGLWLGPDAAYKRFLEILRLPEDNDDEHADKLLNLMYDYPYLFAEEEDGDPYNWLEVFGAYSPIIHLQQTDGKVSAHWGFTEGLNKKGIIKREKVIESLYRSFRTEGLSGMPPKTSAVYLTLEMFTSTSSINYDQLQDISKSAEYWRKIVPEDGMYLDEIINNTGVLNAQTTETV